MKKYYFALVLTLFVLPFFAQNIPSYVPKDGLVGYWPFNGNANDESGNGNHGTVNGATLTEDRNGVVNSAYSFNGINNFIELKSGTSSTMNVIADISYCFWLNTVQQTNGLILAFGNETNPGGGYLAGLADGGADPGYLGYNISGNAKSWSSSSLNLSNNRWNFVVITLQKDTMKLYINSKLDKVTFDVEPTYSWDGNRRIGVANYDFKAFYEGILDDIAIYNRALTEKEITALYTSCINETATSSNFNSLLLSTGSSVSLSAVPQGGVFRGASIDSNKFIPSKAKIGTNKVQYNFKNSQGCNDSTLFTMIVADTLGTTCKKYDTITVTNKITN